MGSGLDQNCTCTTRPCGQQHETIRWVSTVLTYRGERGTRYCLRTDGWTRDERVLHKKSFGPTGRHSILESPNFDGVTFDLLTFANKTNIF